MPEENEEELCFKFEECEDCINWISQFYCSCCERDENESPSQFEAQKQKDGVFIIEHDDPPHPW